MYSPPDFGNIPASSLKHNATHNDNTPEKIHIIRDIAMEPQLFVNETGDINIPEPMITPVMMEEAYRRLMSFRIRTVSFAAMVLLV